MCDTAMCQVVAYSDSLGSHLGSRWDHNFASSHMKPVIPAEIGGCNFSSFVIPSVIPRHQSMQQKATVFWPVGGGARNVEVTPGHRTKEQPSNLLLDNLQNLQPSRSRSEGGYKGGFYSARNGGRKGAKEEGRC